MPDTLPNIGVYFDGVGNRGKAGHVNAKDMLLLTNKHGSALVTGDVGVADTTVNSGFIGSSTLGSFKKVVVVPQDVTGNDVATSKSIADSAAGLVFSQGYVPAVHVSGSVTRWDYLKVSGTTKKLTSTGVSAASATTPIPVGACAIALSTGTDTDIPVFLLPFTFPGVGGRAVSSSAPSDLQALMWNASASQWEPRYVKLHSDTTEVTVGNTASETTLVNGTITIPANTIPSGKEVVGWMWFDLLQNQGASRSLTFKIKLGSTTMVTLTVDYGNNATHRLGCLHFILRGEGASAQECTAEVIGFLLGTGSNAEGGAASGTATENSATDLAFNITGTHQSASATETVTTKGLLILGPY